MTMERDGMKNTLDLDPSWEFVADTVMGGVSQGAITTGPVHGRTATRLTGRVSLDNNGGFVQMATDLNPDGTVRDASHWRGLELDLCGNGETYELRLRTDHLTRPWQSYRAGFSAAPDWATLRFPFADFTPHRTDTPFDPARLHRVGVIAIGRAFTADIAVSALRLYR
ncbi:CIA30 family protein [Aliiroseovarius zhejiangensis]|uniref:CIA30 family protein n=1 Tax=Aliiroseovarius zhejiangensis TaxID=1632025 RepID=A0ABQ3J608_9RHOB|nr:CIA30 family protein [Aliiroseovarius zhejiangensis]GHF04100.1 CIA30 family protein [Aliiroseovarius zhejiangensis]